MTKLSNFVKKKLKAVTIVKFGQSFCGHLQDRDIVVNRGRIDVKVWMLVNHRGKDEAALGLAMIMLANLVVVMVIDSDGD